MASTSIAAPSTRSNPPAGAFTDTFDDSERVRVSFTVNQLHTLRDTLLNWRSLEEDENEYLYDLNNTEDRAQIEALRAYHQRIDALIIDLEDILGV